MGTFTRYLKAQGLVLLVGGVVGPVFLTVFFATGRDPLLKWMFYAGLVITAADVLVALALTSRAEKSAARDRYLEQRGVLALGRVTGITETGVRINDQPMVKVAFRITGPGLAAFDAEERVIASVTRLPIITGGQMVVLVDPATGQYRIDWQRSALVSGMLPAQFSIAEDNATYDLRGQVGPLMEILRILQEHRIPLDGEIDVRADPVVRQQVSDIVRRAVRGTAPES